MKALFEGRLLVISFLVVLSIFLIIMGVGGVVLTGDPSYNSTNSAIVQQHGFTHLDLSNDAFYGFLLAYWSFDKDNSSTAVDLSLSDIDGRYLNGLNTNYSCIYDNCPQFDSVNDFINISDNNGDFNFSASDNFTVTFWINPSPATTPRFFAKSLNTNSSWEIFSPAANGIRWNTRNLTGAAQALSAVNAIPAGQWTHVAARKEGGNKTFYFNGFANVSINNGFGDFGLGTDPLIIGAAATQSTLFMNGSLDDIMIFRTALTSEDIAEIYNNQSSRFTRSGSQTFYNINFGSDDSVNATLSTAEINFGSFFAFKINSGNEVNFTQGQVFDYNITGDSANATVVISHNPSDSQFYAPLLAGNITIVSNAGSQVQGSNNGGTVTLPAVNGGGRLSERRSSSFWTATIEDTELAPEDPTVTTDIRPTQKTRVRVNQESYEIGIVSIMENSAVLDFTFNSGQETLDVGEVRKFEVDGDDYYDLEVSLDSVDGNSAKITVNYIQEEIIYPPQETQTEKSATEEVKDSVLGNYIFIGVIALIVLGVLIVAFFIRMLEKSRTYSSYSDQTR